MHPSTACSKKARIATLAAAEVNAVQVGNRRQHGEEGWGVVLVAVNIVARTRLAGPGFGIAFPAGGDIVETRSGHSGDLAGEAALVSTERSLREYRCSPPVA